MGKKQLVLYGNCQIRAISNILSMHSDFSDEYEITATAQVHTLQNDSADHLTTHIRNADVFIYQSVSPGFRGTNFSTDYLKTITDARCIWLFNYWFRGYNPEMGEVRTSGEKKPIDLMIFRHYYKGKSSKQAYEYLRENDDPVAEKYTTRIARKGIAGLKDRQNVEVEHGCEIVGASDLFSTWKSRLLGNSKNHPTPVYYEIICNRILDKLNLPHLCDGWWKLKCKTAEEFIHEIHALVRWPIYSNVKRICPEINFEMTELPFGEPDWGSFDQFDLDYIEHWYSMYEKEPDLYFEFYRKHLINEFFPI